jgi:hypothetical protein
MNEQHPETLPTSHVAPDPKRPPLRSSSLSVEVADSFHTPRPIHHSFSTTSRWQSTHPRTLSSPSFRNFATNSPHVPTNPLSLCYLPSRGLRLNSLCLKPWLPLIMYGITSLAFLIAFSLWRVEVFARECAEAHRYTLYLHPIHPGLDELAHRLRADESYGHAVLFALIFLTTIREC